MSIDRNGRVLVVLSHLASGDTDYLYRFIDAAGRTTAETILGDDYARVVKLYDRNATAAKLVAALRTEGAKASVQRIDLLVMLHGLPGELVFFNDVHMTSADLSARIQGLNIGAKLRLVYSTACYGDSHSRDFITAGFDSAIGGRKVVANAAVEFAPLLSLWQFNVKLSDCLAPTVPPTGPSDAAATAYGRANNTSWKNDVDSTKVLRGRGALKISS